MKNLICPISDQRVNEKVTRLNAMFTIGIIVLAHSLNSTFLMVVLMTDFFIRAFTDIKFSPVSFLSQYLSNAIGLQTKLIDKAPKIFAARIGFLLTAVIISLFVLDLKHASVIVSGILVIFAGLEFLFAFCAGCVIFSYVVLPFYKK